MQGGARLKFVLLLASALVVALLLALLSPSLLDADKLGKQITARLTIWTGGKVTVTGPVRLTYFPAITLEADGITIKEPQHLPMLREVNAKTMRVELSPWSVMVGSGGISRLTLMEPRVTLASRDNEQDSAASHLLTTVQATPLARLSLVSAEIRPADGSAPLIKDLDAEIDLSVSGAMDGQGRFSWRGERLAYTFDTGDPAIEGNTAKAPLRLSLTTPMIAATMSGEAAVADGLQLNGKLDLTIPRLRAFAAWMGVPVSQGNGLGELKAAGAFRWHGDRLDFDDGAFVLDGNAAQGALAINFGGERPALVGTLALQRLTLAPYLTPPASASVTAGDRTIAFEPSLLRLIDADLRLSTGEVQAVAFVLGQTALSLHLADGALGADFSVLNICEGKADGRIEVNAANLVPRLRLAASATGLAARPCLETFGAAPSPIEGATSFAIDLTSIGETEDEILSSLGGTTSFTIENGQASIDIAKMFALAKQHQLRGWEAVRGTPTRFASLTGQCVLDHGIAHCASVRVGNGVTGVTGNGNLDLVSGTMDWRLRVTSKVAEPLQQVGKLISGLLDDLVVEGSWADPTFRLPGSDSSSLDRRDGERFAAVPRPY